MTALDNDPFADEMERLGTPDMVSESPRQSNPVKWHHGYILDSKGLWFDPGEDKPRSRLSGPFTILGLLAIRTAMDGPLPSNGRTATTSNTAISCPWLI